MSFRVIEGGRDDRPLPAYLPPRSRQDDGDPARGIANAVLIGAAMWGIGFTIWWAWASGACR